ncbi:hypothetical protein NFJ02_02g75040 [Pycnococcus provasolii]
MRVFVPLAIVMYALCGVAYVRMRYATNEIALDEGDDSMLEGESLDSVLDASTDDADGSGDDGGYQHDREAEVEMTGGWSSGREEQSQTIVDEGAQPETNADGTFDGDRIVNAESDDGDGDGDSNRSGDGDGDNDSLEDNNNMSLDDELNEDAPIFLDGEGEGGQQGEGDADADTDADGGAADIEDDSGKTISSEAPNTKDATHDQGRVSSTRSTTKASSTKHTTLYAVHTEADARKEKRLEERKIRNAWTAEKRREELKRNGQSVRSYYRQQETSTLLQSLLTVSARKVVGDTFVGLDPVPSVAETEPFVKTGRRVVDIGELVRTQNKGYPAFDYEGCGRVHVRLTGSDNATAAEMAQQFVWPPRASAVKDQSPLPWPDGAKNVKVLVIDGSTMDGVKVLHLEDLCDRLDTLKNTDVVAGEVEGDATPCIVSVAHYTLNYGFYDAGAFRGNVSSLLYERGCQRCNMAPSVFLAKAERLQTLVGRWPTTLRPYARLAFFLKARGKLRVLRCRGVAAFTRPRTSMLDRMRQDGYARAHAVGDLYGFRRILSAGGYVRWLGCARTSKHCLQRDPMARPSNPKDLVCCAHLIKHMIDQISEAFDAAGASVPSSSAVPAGGRSRGAPPPVEVGPRWSLWRSSLLGMVRDGALLPWKAKGAVAVSRPMERLLGSMVAPLTAAKSTYILTKVDGTWRMIYQAPLPLYFKRDQWRGFSLSAGIETGGGGGGTAAAKWNSPFVLRNAAIKCTSASRCRTALTPTFLDVLAEERTSPPSRLAKVLPRNDSSVATAFREAGLHGVVVDAESPKGWYVRQDRLRLLSQFYGKSWRTPACDWRSGAGDCGA